MKHIDDFLNTITMYRLLLYYLIILNIIGIFVVGPLLIISALFLLAVSLISNSVFAAVYEAHTNVESVYISALILSLILSPPRDLHGLIFIGWAATLTTASKYILALGKKHMFNPVAIAVVLTSIAGVGSATWWVGAKTMIPIVFFGGMLIVRKIQREDLFFSYIICAAAVTYFHNPGLLLFFATIMLTEPLTTPPTKTLRMIYGALVGLLFAPQIRFMTPEIALVLGNIFSYIVSPKEKLMLQLKEKILLAPNIYDYIFQTNHVPAFVPGQYMEWTLGHKHPDARGNRRYFTIASSPTEPDLRLGVRFYDASSSYKKTLQQMQPGATIVAGERAGDFVLPKNQKQKLVFIAGGIGITPFRSMIQFLHDTNQPRDIVLLYTVHSPSEIIYKDVLEYVKTMYIVTERDGRLDTNKIQTLIPDWKERLFYLSGPNSLVNGFSDVLSSLGVHRNMIKKDFFPGFM